MLPAERSRDGIPHSNSRLSPGLMVITPSSSLNWRSSKARARIFPELSRRTASTRLVEGKASTCVRLPRLLKTSTAAICRSFAREMEAEGRLIETESLDALEGFEFPEKTPVTELTRNFPAEPIPSTVLPQVLFRTLIGPRAGVSPVVSGDFSSAAKTPITEQKRRARGMVTLRIMSLLTKR